MKWLEIIHLRTAEQDTNRLMPYLKQLINDTMKEGICQDIKMYKRAFLKTDICFHLSHDTDQVENSGSPVGQRLAMALEAFGMVSSTIWIVRDDIPAR